MEPVQRKKMRISSRRRLFFVNKHSLRPKIRGRTYYIICNWRMVACQDKVRTLKPLHLLHKDDCDGLIPWMCRELQPGTLLITSYVLNLQKIMYIDICGLISTMHHNLSFVLLKFLVIYFLAE
ncbi:hypothetical protein ACQJBY_027951 [Aegilops geniculata]